MHMQERLLEDDEEGGLPGLDLSDSDDDATWNPQMDKPANDMRSRYITRVNTARTTIQPAPV